MMAGRSIRRSLAHVPVLNRQRSPCARPCSQAWFPIDCVSTPQRLYNVRNADFLSARTDGSERISGIVGVGGAAGVMTWPAATAGVGASPSLLGAEGSEGTVG